MPLTVLQYDLCKYKNQPTHNRTVEIARCTPADLDAVLTLQNTILAVLPDKEIFVPTDSEEIMRYLQSPNIVLGCFDGTQLIAYASIVLHGLHHSNLGYDLHLPAEELPFCANFDTVIVHPDYRGNHLQKVLIQESEKMIKSVAIKKILTTVSPKNLFSLRNFQSMGYKIEARKIKYGGKDRYVLLKTL